MLLAVLLALPPGVAPAQADLLPVGDAICHADGSNPGDHHAPTGQPEHVHCALCLAGLAFLSPSAPALSRSPTILRLELSVPPASRPHLPDAPGAYASRAPPRIG